MKKFALSLLTLTSVISMSTSVFATTACMTENQARETLLSKEAGLRKEIKEKYGKNASRTKVAQAILNAQWDESRQAFFTGALHYWVCGPGAECWVHATLNCDGQTSLIEIGD